MQQDGSRNQALPWSLLGIIRQPRVMLVVLAAWSLLAAVTQLFPNSSVFLDVHGRELDGALGGFALSFNALPLAVLYAYCARNPDRYYHVFWLALVHQTTMAAGNLYHLAIGTFSFESVLVPCLGAIALAALSFAQVFEPRTRTRPLGA